MTAESRGSRRDIIRGGAVLTAAASAATLLAAARAAAQAPPTTFVVAHGAWSSGWAWKKMHPLMAAKGHRLFTPSYTGVGERAHLANPDINLDTHITDVVNHLFYEDLSDVVLIGYSYGGMVATGVADRARDRIATLIYLDAFVPEDGQSLVDLTGQPDPRERAVDGWRVPPSGTLPPDVSEEDAAWITPRRGDQPVETLLQPLRLTQGPLTLPRHYIHCTETFQPFADKSAAAGWPVFRLNSGHMPHITIPEELAALLETIVSG
jgi:pimeloyl-ACP methyl ester carboxylesterase